MKDYKYKLKPSAKIIAIFESWLALLCELYNAALQERRGAYRINHLSINYTAQANQLPEIKKDRPEFAGIHSQVIQNVLKRVEAALDCFYGRIKEGRRAGFPRFRSRSRYDSFTYPQSGFSLGEQTAKAGSSPASEEAFEGQTAATRFSFQRGAKAGLAVPEHHG